MRNHTVNTLFKFSLFYYSIILFNNHSFKKYNLVYHPIDKSDFYLRIISMTKRYNYYDYVYSNKKKKKT